MADDVAAGKVGYKQANPNDPSGTRGFEEEPITHRDHNDPDKHWIGESLQPPSISDVKSAGRFKSTGESVIVARADHTHEGEMWVSRYYGNPVVCGPGTSYFNGWVHNGSTNILVPGSTQTFNTPYDGYWMITVNFVIDRNGGGTFTNEANHLLIVNGITPYYIMRGSNFDIPIQGYATWTIVLAVGVNTTFQFRYDHNDAVNHTLTSPVLQFMRMSAFV